MKQLEPQVSMSAAKAMKIEYYTKTSENIAAPKWKTRPILVSGRGLACQQEISLVLAKTTRGSCVFNACEHRVSRDLYANEIYMRDVLKHLFHLRLFSR